MAAAAPFAWDYSGAIVERSAYAGILLLQVAILAVGAFLASHRKLTVGALASFQALFLSSSYSLANFSQYFPTVVEAPGGLRRIKELLDHAPSTTEDGWDPVPRGCREIQVYGVTFGYSPKTTCPPLREFLRSARLDRGDCGSKRLREELYLESALPPLCPR